MVSKNYKNPEIALIEEEIAFTKQKLTLGAKTLPNATIVHLMNILGELTIRKDLMLELDTIAQSAQNRDDNPAWQLHKKAQSGFELKVGNR